MCGIAGVYDCDKRAAPDALGRIAQAMERAIAHRGPDASGLWTDGDVPLTLAHRRLSVIDLSEGGAQPMASHNGRYVITFNGEIYNFQDLRRTLEGEGAAFRGRSDTEIMLAAFERWGINRALQKINGMFAFALWDREKRQLHLVRDRMGKKPLYLGWAGRHFVFGSELKALHAHPDFRAEINRNSLALYMRFGCVPAPHSIYQGVWQLPPGHRITLILDMTNPGDDLAREWIPYWNITRAVEESRNSPLQMGDGELTDRFESLLGAVVADRMVSDVPLGVFLSGGIDSSAVTALMQARSAVRIKTFSIGFAESGYNEAEDARKIAAHLGTDHNEMIVTPEDALAVIPQLPEIYDEPFADSSQIPTLLVSKFARSQVTVALSGDGGDEMLGGYVRHRAVPALWHRIGWVPQPVCALAARTIRSVSIERWNRLVPRYPQFGERLYKAASVLPLGSLEDAYIHVMSQWENPTQIVRESREPLIALQDPSVLPRGLGFAERMLFGDTLSYLPNDILTKVDRASMAVALEVRAPLLDTRVFDFCWRLPAESRLRGRHGKWLLRQVLNRYVPEEMYDRPKQGFAVPLADWLRGPLRDWAHELLRPARLETEGYINPVPVTAAWADHLAGRGNHAGCLWAVLMFQSWLARWR